MHNFNLLLLSSSPHPLPPLILFFKSNTHSYNAQTLISTFPNSLILTTIPSLFISNSSQSAFTWVVIRKSRHIVLQARGYTYLLGKIKAYCKTLGDSEKKWICNMQYTFYFILNIFQKSWWWGKMMVTCLLKQRSTV